MIKALSMLTIRSPILITCTAERLRPIEASITSVAVS